MTDKEIVKAIIDLEIAANFDETKKTIEEIATNNWVNRKKTIDNLICDNNLQIVTWQNYDKEIKNKVIEDYRLIKKALKLEKKLSWKK